MPESLHLAALAAAVVALAVAIRCAIATRRYGGKPKNPPTEPSRPSPRSRRSTVTAIIDPPEPHDRSTHRPQAGDPSPAGHSAVDPSGGGAA